MPSAGASATWASFGRAAVECAVRAETLQTSRAPPPPHPTHSGVFVTLHKFNRLRGCMGVLEPRLALIDAIAQAARLAALHDPRFPPVTPAELSDLHIEVSILSEPFPMRSLAELELGRHGILVQRGVHRGLFLPQVATEHRFDKEQFLSRCCSEKAGLPPDAWREPDTQVLLFTADIHRE